MEKKLFFNWVTRRGHTEGWAEGAAAPGASLHHLRGANKIQFFLPIANNNNLTQEQF